MRESNTIILESHNSFKTDSEVSKSVNDLISHITSDGEENSSGDQISVSISESPSHSMGSFNGCEKK